MKRLEQQRLNLPKNAIANAAVRFAKTMVFVYVYVVAFSVDYLLLS